MPILGVVVHPSEEVAALYISQGTDGPVFHAPDGTDWPLRSKPAAPSLTGSDAQYHPMQLANVEAAVRGIQYPLGDQHFEIFILPMPRRDLSGSAAGSGALFLAPGVRVYTSQEIHFVVSHEMGHLVQAALMPDSDTLSWSRYKSMRGISNGSIFNARAEHARRPHEVFAEDFRFLFGDDQSRYTGGIENSALNLPTLNPDVRSFFLALSSQPAPATAALGALAAGPNPFVSGTVLTFTLPVVYEAVGASPTNTAGLLAGSLPVTLDIVSASGRRVRRLFQTTYQVGTYRVVFDGQDEAGRRLPGGIWFARLAAGSRVTTRKLTLVR